MLDAISIYSCTCTHPPRSCRVFYEGSMKVLLDLLFYSCSETWRILNERTESYSIEALYCTRLEHFKNRPAKVFVSVHFVSLCNGYHKAATGLLKTGSYFEPALRLN